MTHISCNRCEKLLTEGDHAGSYLVLASHATGGRAGPARFACDSLVEPLLPQPHHFCDLACLAQWAGERAKAVAHG